jgi:hypothetical protein
MNVRSAPATSAPVTGAVSAGEILAARSILGTDAWILTDKGWVCVKQGNKRFAKPVER